MQYSTFIKCAHHSLGIGRDLCEKLNDFGAKVYAVSRSKEPLDELKAKCPNVEILALDLGGNWNEVRTQLAQFLKDVKVHGLVNNAGVAKGLPFEEITEENYDL